VRKRTPFDSPHLARRQLRVWHLWDRCKAEAIEAAAGI
jgi:hypothetical protein